MTPLVKNLNLEDIDGMVTDFENKIRTAVYQFRKVYPRLLHIFVDDLRLRISSVLSDARKEIIILDNDDNQTCVQNPMKKEIRANDVGENETIFLDEVEFSHTQSKVKGGFEENIINKQPLLNIGKVTNINQPRSSDDTLNSLQINAGVECSENLANNLEIINGTSPTTVHMTKQFQVYSSDHNASLNQVKIISLDDNNGTNVNDRTETASTKDQIKSNKRKARGLKRVTGLSTEELESSRNYCDKRRRVINRKLTK